MAGIAKEERGVRGELGQLDTKAEIVINDERWAIDSAAVRHLARDVSSLDDVRDDATKIVGVGSRQRCDGRGRRGRLERVYALSKLPINLLSVGEMLDQRLFLRYEVVGEEGKRSVWYGVAPDETRVVMGVRDASTGGLWCITQGCAEYLGLTRSSRETSVFAAGIGQHGGERRAARLPALFDDKVEPDWIDTVRRRMGFPSARLLLETTKSGRMKGLGELDKKMVRRACARQSESVLRARLRNRGNKKKGKKRRRRATRFLEYLHMDTQIVKQRDAADKTVATHCMHVIVDDFSNWVWVLIMDSLSELPARLDDWIAKTELECREEKREGLGTFVVGEATGDSSEFEVKTIRCDRHRAQLSEAMKETALRKRYIALVTNATERHNANAVVERMIQTVVGMRDTLLLESGLPWDLWPYAARAACDVINVRSSKANEGRKSPWEVRYRSAPSIDFLRSFGATVYFSQEGKQGGRVGIWVGRERRSDSHWIYDPKSAAIINNGSTVVFNEAFSEYPADRLAKMARGEFIHPLNPIPVVTRRQTRARARVNPLQQTGLPYSGEELVDDQGPRAQYRRYHRQYEKGGALATRSFRCAHCGTTTVNRGGLRRHWSTKCKLPSTQASGGAGQGARTEEEEKRSDGAVNAQVGSNSAPVSSADATTEMPSAALQSSSGAVSAPAKTLNKSNTQILRARLRAALMKEQRKRKKKKEKEKKEKEKKKKKKKGKDTESAREGSLRRSSSQKKEVAFAPAAAAAGTASTTGAEAAGARETSLRRSNRPHKPKRHEGFVRTFAAAVAGEDEDEQQNREFSQPLAPNVGYETLLTLLGYEDEDWQELQEQGVLPDEDETDHVPDYDFADGEIEGFRSADVIVAEDGRFEYIVQETTTSMSASIFGMSADVEMAGCEGDWVGTIPSLLGRVTPRQKEEAYIRLPNVKITFENHKQYTPPSQRAALLGPHAEEMRAAMEKEIKQMNDYNVWHGAKLPRNGRLVDLKFVYAWKFRQDGEGGLEVERAKARLVARGFSQRGQGPGASFDPSNISSPVGRATTFQYVLSHAAKHKMHLRQVDIKGAFLISPLHEDVYVRFPWGVERGEGHDCLKLDYSLYGLRQSSRNYFEKLSSDLKALGWRQSTVDPCLFHFTRTRYGKKEVAHLVTWVDDILFSSTSVGLYEDFCTDLEKTNPISKKGKLDYLLGMKIKYNREEGILRMSQEERIRALVEDCGLEREKPCSLPIKKRQKKKRAKGQVAMAIPKTEQERLTQALAAGFGSYREMQRWYRGVLGVCGYLSGWGRFDIRYATYWLARFQANPSKLNVQMARDLVRYLHGSAKRELVYGSPQTPDFLAKDPLVAMVDADFAGAIDQKSTTGYGIWAFGNLIYFRSTKQRCCSTSTTQAELVAASQCARHVLYMRRLSADMGVDPGRVPIYEDNAGCAQISRGGGSHQRRRHIRVADSWLWLECHEHKTMEVVPIAGTNNIADLGTKAVDQEVWDRLIEPMMGTGSNRNFGFDL